MNSILSSPDLRAFPLVVEFLKNTDSKEVAKLIKSF